MTDMDALAEESSTDDLTAEPERTSARSLAKAGLVVSGAYLVSRVLGYLRVLLEWGEAFPGFAKEVEGTVEKDGTYHVYCLK